MADATLPPDGGASIARMPPVLAIGAVGLLGLAAVKLFTKVAQERAEEQASRAQHGWSLDELAAALTSGYDGDRDGRLAYDAVRGMRTLGESTKVHTRTWSESPGMLRLVLPAGTRVLRERHETYSIEPTLRKADADQDGVTTRAELVALLRAWDPDGNGRVTKLDYDRALAQLGGVRVHTETRTVGVVPPPTGPAAPVR